MVFLAAKAQLNTCTCVASVCVSVVKPEFLPVDTPLYPLMPIYAPLWPFVALCAPLCTLTLFDRIGNRVANTQCDPIGTQDFVLLLTKDVHFMSLVTKVCQLAPRQGRAGRAPCPA